MSRAKRDDSCPLWRRMSLTGPGGDTGTSRISSRTTKAGDLWVSESDLHGTGLMIADEWRLPGNSDRLRQWHSSVSFVSGEVLQAAGVRLFLPVLKKRTSSQTTSRKTATGRMEELLWPHLSGYICRGRSEAKPGRCVLLLLHPLHSRAEVELHVKALLRGDILHIHSVGDAC